MALRILHSIHSVDPQNGGPIEGVKQLTQAHLQQGLEVELVSLDDPQAPWVREFPFKLHTLGPVRTKYGYTSKLTPWLKAHAHLYDAVIVNGLWQFPGLAVRNALHRSSTPYYVFTHGMLDPWFKQTYPLKHLKKCLYWPWAESRVLRDAEAVFFTCEQERLLARESFRNYQCRELVVGYGAASPPGIPAQQRNLFLNRFPECKGKRTWLFLGRLHVKKGCDLLLRAFANLASTNPQLHLVMAGPDQTGWMPQLQQISRQLGIESKVSWTGMLNGDLKWGALHAAENFILPSHQENFGIAVAEAAACGLPVLISDKVNIWREIEQDNAGLVASDDLAGTISLGQRWLDLPETAKRAMRENAHRCFQNRFEMGQVATRLTHHLRSHSNRSQHLTSTLPATAELKTWG